MFPLNLIMCGGSNNILCLVTSAFLVLCYKGNQDILDIFVGITRAEQWSGVRVTSSCRLVVWIFMSQSNAFTINTFDWLIQIQFSQAQEYQEKADLEVEIKVFRSTNEI